MQHSGQFDEALTTVRRENADAFAYVCGILGFTPVDRGGRYPHVCVERIDSVVRSLHLEMAVDEGGQYLKAWDRSTPFEVSACASVDRTEDGVFVRYRARPIRLPAQSYGVVILELRSTLFELGTKILRLSVEEIVAEGVRTVPRRA